MFGETLNTTEATYIWHIAKDIDIDIIKITLQKINDIIKLMKTEGKTAYIKTTEDNFTRIYHDYSNTVDGFVKWKNDLEFI